MRTKQQFPALPKLFQAVHVSKELGFKPIFMAKNHRSLISIVSTLPFILILDLHWTIILVRWRLLYLHLLILHSLWTVIKPRIMEQVLPFNLLHKTPWNFLLFHHVLPVVSVNLKHLRTWTDTLHLCFKNSTSREQYSGFFMKPSHWLNNKWIFLGKKLKLLILQSKMVTGLKFMLDAQIFSFKLVRFDYLVQNILPAQWTPGLLLEPNLTFQIGSRDSAFISIPANRHPANQPFHHIQAFHSHAYHPIKCLLVWFWGVKLGYLHQEAVCTMTTIDQMCIDNTGIYLSARRQEGQFVCRR